MDHLSQWPDPVGRSRAASPGGPRNARLTAREQFGLAVLAVERARRDAVASLRRSRYLRWRYRAKAADELLMVPPDLRAHDPSFADEVAAGSLGLAGCATDITGRSPFSIPAPSPEWARELHGFGWLRHLDAARSVQVEAMARTLVRDWMVSRRHHQLAWEPDVVARRVISWLSHIGLLLDGAKRRPYSALMRSLGRQLAYLSACWRDAPDGYPRLLALVALVQADLCIAGRDRELAQSEKLLAAELARQVLPDGGHISRNPWVLVELLLDLLPLRQVFAARGKKPDDALLAAIARMTPMLRHLRLGDGMLARFNGMGAAAEHGVLATVLAYDAQPAAIALRSGYARLARGSTLIIADVGSPPPLDVAGAACAGCLSFELSTGAEPLLVNAGAPGSAEGARRPLSRGTASHNTLCLNEQSSSKLVRNARLERRIGAPPILHPDNVTCEAREVDGGIRLQACHDGYVQRFGLIHTRTLELSPDGYSLRGTDRLDAAKGVLRFAQDVPLALHFHLHPDAQVVLGATPDAAELLLDSGEQWRLTASGIAVSIEESLHLADIAGARRAQQVVLRTVCYGATEIMWMFQRIREGRPRDSTGRKHTRNRVPLSERLAETDAGFDDGNALGDAS